MSLKYILGRNEWRTFDQGIEKEWILTNGLGGFANQSIIGANGRIYSGYLIAAMNPPVDRMMIFPKTHEYIQREEEEIDLCAQDYINEKREGERYLNRFELDVIPTYTYQVDDITIKKTVALEYGKNTAVVCYEVENGDTPISFNVTPLFTCRPSGEVAEKADLQFDVIQKGKVLALKPKKYPEICIQFMTSEGEYYDRGLIPTSMATPNYLIEENEVYRIDNRTGFLGVDNHVTPVDVRVKLEAFEKKSFYIKCTVDELDEKDGFEIARAYKERMYDLMNQVPGANDFAKRLAQAADHFIVKRNSTNLKTILAGYPWFSDWGRDTMIALQGLTLCTRRFEDARDILESFSKYVKNGLIPNVFANSAKDEPGYNTIDGSLWYFYSVHKYLEYTGQEEDYAFIQEKIYPCLKEIVEGYKNGTDYHIHMDEDGLVLGGSNLDQLTWMDVRVGEWVVTPRHGKAVEINALWYNALRVMEELATRFGEDSTAYSNLAEKVKESFNTKFWYEEGGYLYDVVDENDTKIRPNQIWAISLPYTMLPEEKELKVVQTVYKHLYTPYGIRSLSYTDPEYKSQYIGKLINRDGAYHMGTTWGFISGGFISAYCKVHHHSEEAIKKAQEMCELFDDHMHDGCLNGIAEIFDGDAPCTSRGCYTQAWSVGEVLRAYMEDVLPYSKY